ncbi:glycerophosphodiester phosphodiesterase [Deinococcus wulumuqiensis]|uniref:glycerophosphodiester phosphodiesterase n=1 Tax=Deinococcus wulumuqiensis TaxID=980427 RepID=UPI00242B4003|nr:glycerophosphodiester phosphodiesterase [Deinococcus wulumuqiensis]
MPLLLGHRGSPHEHRENTLAGFQAALDAGLDGTELDVRRLGDGTLAVHHDAALRGGAALAGLTRAELPTWVPTLPDVLAWAADTGAYLNIELKWEAWAPDDRVARTLGSVRAHGLSRRVLLSSFHPLLLRAARELAPDVERGLLYHRPYRSGPLNLPEVVGRWVDCTALHPHHTLIDRDLLALARRRGWRVNAWTVNEEAEVQRLAALGVDGLIGDVPAHLLTARRGRK